MEIVKFFVSKGVSIQAYAPKTKSFFAGILSPLAAACKNEDEEMAFYLLENKAVITESIADLHTEFTSLILRRYR